MKNNTEKIKQFLSQAVKNWPEDFALSEAKSHLVTCIRKVEQIEARRRRQGEAEQTQAQKWQATLNSNVQNPLNIQQTLNVIDDMIAEEKMKLEAIAERKRQKSSPEPIEDIDDDTLLG